MSIAIDYSALINPAYVLNHDIMHCTADAVVGNHLYSARALGISEPDDVVQLHPDLKPLWEYICSHYQRIGLSFSEQVVWQLDLQQLKQHHAHQPSVFYFGKDEQAVWQDEAWFNTVDYINSKNNFIALAQALNVAVPDTLCFDDVNVIDSHTLSHLNYPCYLKAAISVAGVGIYRCENSEALRQAKNHFAAGIPVQIQAEIKTDCFLNLQYQIKHNQLRRLESSEQILDGFSHQGNRVPSTYQPWDVVEPMANWLYQEGMQGIFAFDVGVVHTNTNPEFFAIECNPRFNGASYPTLIAKKLNISTWQALNLSTRHRHLSRIDLSGLEYNQHSQTGVIIVNWGTVLRGKIAVLLAGTEDEQANLLAILRARL
jgi:hypothetical protein